MASAALAPPDVKDVTLSLFGGRVTDIAPSDAPEGVTPDSEDGIYLPGEWQSRPGLARLYANGKLTPGWGEGWGNLWGGGVEGNPPASVLYEKTYVLPNNDPLTLMLTSDGVLWAEDVNNAPENPTQIGQLPPGLYAQSVSEFGREYIAFSDLLHGQGIPLQFDGTFLDRVTMDGPGAPPTVADLVQTPVDLTTGSIGLEGPVSTITNITESGNVATVTTAVAHGYVPNQTVLIVDTGVSGYNGLQIISTVPSPDTYTFVLDASGLGGASAGSSFPAIGVITVPTASVPLPLPVVGDTMTVTGTGTAFDNSADQSPPNWQIIDATSAGGNISIQFDLSTGNPQGTYSTVSVGKATLGGQSAPGVHQVVVMFLTRQGYITAPSPQARFVSVGNSKWKVTGIPIGPSNVVARVLGFTGAGGDNFFIIPASVILPNPSAIVPTPIVVQSTIVPDNTSTEYTFDVPDNTLFAAVPIDQVGNDLFDQVVLGPVAAFFAYASRLATWGDYNKVENFLNLGFCGGYLP